MKNDELLHKWINGALTNEELESFKERPEYDSLVELYKETDGWDAPAFNSEAMLSAIVRETKNAPKPIGRRVFLSSWAKYAVAAAIVLIGGWFLFLRDNGVILHKVAAGEKLEGELPDGSAFYLNAESELTFQTKNWENNRLLKLSGEAFFSVKKGSAFKVVTPNGSVQVLGTKFNVLSRGDCLDVQCTHGKVSVTDNKGSVVAELGAFEAVQLKSGSSPEKYQVAEQEEVSWISGITKLREVPLYVVLEELERQFAIEIKSEGVDLEEIISCNFQHEDLNLALKTTLAPLGLSYEIKNDKLVEIKN